MKTITFWEPKTVKFTERQVREIKHQWRENWSLPPDTKEEITDEDILTTADGMGLIELHSNFKVL